jgi:hypothetical protein
LEDDHKGVGEMVTRRAASIGLVALLSLGSVGLTACDRKDRRDIEEGGNGVEREVDNADNDGQDD